MICFELGGLSVIEGNENEKNRKNADLKVSENKGP